MKITDKKILSVRIITFVFLLFSCFYMYDFYKCLSGFVANEFREHLVMLPMIFSFFLPVFCFLFFVYDFYVKAINKPVKTIYSVFVIIYSAVNLALIFSNITLYMSNNSLGVYSSLPSIIIHFPYDMIVILSLLLLLQIFNLYLLYRKDSRVNEFLYEIKQHGTLKLCVIEYIVLSIFAIVIFVFTGSAIYAVFSAFENAFYDLRYCYLLLWVMLIPLGNLLIVTLKPQKMQISKKTKVLTLVGGICANVIFGILFLIFELTKPDFLIHIGKPLFLITFSISLPIEPFVIFGIMALGSVVMTIRLIRTVIDKT